MDDYATSSPLIGPSFLRRSAAGWQFDVISEWACVPMVFGGALTWTWQSCYPPYDEVFYDQLVDIGGIWRMADGDNRLLPVGRTRYSGRLSWSQSLKRALSDVFGR